MPRLLLLAALFTAAFGTLSSASQEQQDLHVGPSAAGTIERLEKLKIERRRSPQQCLILGFVSDQLECDTCETIKADLLADGVSKPSISTAYDDNDIYFQCLSCCTRGKLAGDALRTPSFILDESDVESTRKRKKKADENEDTTGPSTSSNDESNHPSLPPPPPYVLPPSPSYWRARCEISMMLFEQNHDWYRFLEKVEKLFPFTQKDAEVETAISEQHRAPTGQSAKADGAKKKGGSGKNSLSSSEGTNSNGTPTPTSLVEVFPVYQHRSVIYLYGENQLPPAGPPDQLMRKGDEAIMFLELSVSSGWDANKVEEFLNHTIKGSVKRQEIAKERERIAQELTEKAHKSEASPTHGMDDEL